MRLWETFDKNEISLSIMLLLAFTIFALLPKKLPRKITLLSLMWGISSAMLFDFTIGGGLLDVYKVNDMNRYEVFDVFYYILFSPFSYFFVYFYEVLKINKKTFLFYIVVWSFIGLAANWLLTKLEIIHFQHGYKLAYSLSVFLIIQTTTGLYYELIKSKARSERQT